MPNQYYSPNSKLTGGALFASFNSKDGAIFFKVLKQIANNPDKKGNFDGKNPINVKLSQDEAADIIRAVRTNGEAKFYHKFDENVTSGSFKFYTIPAKGEYPEKKGFGFSVKRGEQEIKVGFTLGSAERLSLFLQNALVHIFDAEYSKELQEFRERQKQKDGKKEASVTQEEKETEPLEENQDMDF